MLAASPRRLLLSRLRLSFSASLLVSVPHRPPHLSNLSISPLSLLYVHLLAPCSAVLPALPSAPQLPADPSSRVGAPLTCGEGLRQAAQLPGPDAVGAQVPPRGRVVVPQVGARLEALVGRGHLREARVRVRGGARRGAGVCHAPAAPRPTGAPRPRSPFICGWTPAHPSAARGAAGRGGARNRPGPRAPPHPSPLAPRPQTPGGGRGDSCPPAHVSSPPAALCPPGPPPGRSSARPLIALRPRPVGPVALLRPLCPARYPFSSARVRISPVRRPQPSAPHPGPAPPPRPLPGAPCLTSTPFRGEVTPTRSSRPPFRTSPPSSAPRPPHCAQDSPSRLRRRRPGPRAQRAPPARCRQR